MSERPLQCTLKSPILITIPDFQSEFHSGCRVTDVSLSSVIDPEKTVLSLKSAKLKSKVKEEVDLMQFEWINVSALRLILQQPSPVWKEFKIEDLKLFRSSELSKPCPLPAWLTEAQDKSGKKKLESIANLDSLSSTLQQLWALSEEIAAQQTNRTLGKYEVDGCYEINMLSYT